ncbi:MAG: hypothetical protein R3E12_05890 [Candidatus Eisenbacteria bacterium]
MIELPNRKHRDRWVTTAVLVALFVVGLGVGRAFRSEAPEPAEVVVDTATASGVERFSAVNDTIRRGDTLTSVLLRQRVEVQEIGRILERIRSDDLFSPRALRPGQFVTVSRDDYGMFRGLQITLSPEEIYRFDLEGDSLLASRVDVDETVRLRKFEGHIVSSFDEAVRRAGGDYRLTLKVADVLAYDVDFFTDVREGDWFSLLVEVHRGGSSSTTAKWSTPRTRASAPKPRRSPIVGTGGRMGALHPPRATRCGRPS